MPQIVLIRLKRKAFPEVISHLVPAYCATPADSFFFSLKHLFQLHIFILHAYKPVQKPWFVLYISFMLLSSTLVHELEVHIFNNHLFFSSFSDLLQ